ncbi:MAG: pyridoxal phosphate-dependent aminotransferase, partial [Candidatus Omnitrophota bacterium]
TPTSGTLELKEAVCRKFQEDQGLTYTADQVVISCGAKHSLYNLIQVLCQAGDEVLIPRPFWVSYPEMVYLAGAKPIFIDTCQKDGFKLNAEALRQAVTPKSKVVILNSPSNPTGAVLDAGDLKEIAKVIIDNNLLCISDEIYEYYHYDGLKAISIATLSEELKARTFVVNGASKSYSMTGLRIGYLAGDGEVVKKIGILQDHSTSNPDSVSQKMAVAALALPKDYRTGVRDLFEKRRNLLMELLGKIKGFDPYRPKGAFYVFCDISKTGLVSDVLSERLLEEINVAVIPGKSFGSDRHIRLSFASSEKDILEAAQRITHWAAANVR